MSKSQQDIAILFAVAVVMVATFSLIVIREHAPDVVDINQSMTTPVQVGSSSGGLYAPPLRLTETASPDWFLVHNKKYGYYYYRPDMHPLYFYVETFTGEVETKSLDVFVQEIYKINLLENSPNLEESVTEPREVVVNGISAYEMFITGGFDSDDRSFIVELPSRFLFFEAPGGVKLGVYYPVDTRPNNIYEQIIKTFRVSETLIPPKADPADWKEASKGSYRVSYPSNIFKLIEDVEEQDFFFGDGVFLTSVEEGVYGHASFTIEDHTFDPSNIGGMYGKIEDAVKMTINGRDWYQYGWGDAGCGSYIYETGLAEGQTLHVSFGSCPEDDAHPIIDDEPLQQKILETIIFN